MNCKKCGSDKIVKNGKKFGKQRYGCNNCGHVFVEQTVKSKA